MCGIVGFAGNDLGPSRFSRAVHTLHHRGPDGFGVYIDPVEHAGLDHARLSIIDLENGAQPLFGQDGELVLVCNDEIYENPPWRSLAPRQVTAVDPRPQELRFNLVPPRLEIPQLPLLTHCSPRF